MQMQNGYHLTKINLLD